MNHQKNREPLLSSAEREVLRTVVSTVRKTAPADVSGDEKLLDEVLEALQICGYVVLPRGMLDNIRKMLG